MNKIINEITVFIATFVLSISSLLAPAKQAKHSTVPLPTSVSIAPTVIEASPTLIPIAKPQSSPTVILHPAISSTPTPTPDPNKGPGGIVPGQYPADSLTQEQRQWLWKFFGHTGDTPAGYGGEGFANIKFYKGPSKACFTFYGETVSGDTYTRGKPITLDASCSEPNGLFFRWYINDQPIVYFDNIPAEIDGVSKETKIVQKCLGCMGPGNFLSDAREVKIKLEVSGGLVYTPDSTEKIIRFR